MPLLVDQYILLHQHRTRSKEFDDLQTWSEPIQHPQYRESKHTSVLISNNFSLVLTCGVGNRAVRVSERDTNGVSFSRRCAAGGGIFCSHRADVEDVYSRIVVGISKVKKKLADLEFLEHFLKIPSHQSLQPIKQYMTHFYARLRTPSSKAKEKLKTYHFVSLNKTMAAMTFVFPGDSLDAQSLPSHPKLPLKLGPGLRHIPPNTITPTVAGQLCTDKRKNAVWVEYSGSRVHLSYLCPRKKKKGS